MSEKVVCPIGQSQITIETGKLAKQADGAVTIQMGETIVFVAAVAATKAKAGQDFFPLTVDYREKAAAAISSAKAVRPKKKFSLRVSLIARFARCSPRVGIMKSRSKPSPSALMAKMIRTCSRCSALPPR
jgi:hypothetical protein